MPALALDVALVHMNRADAAGNAQFLGPDLYFDDLFCMAAKRASCPASGSCATDAACSTEGSLARRCAINRMMVDGVVEAPNGAHFTACPPDYERDEAFQREYAATAARPGARGRRSGATYLDGDEADYQAAVARDGRRRMSAHASRRARRGLRRRVRRGVARRRRDPREPDRHHADDRRAPGRARPSSPTAADRRRARCSPPTLLPVGGPPPERRRGLDALPRGVRRRLVGPPPRDDGREPDRPLRQPEHRLHRRPRHARRRSCSACAARRATPSTTRQLLGARTTRRASFVPKVDMRLAASATTAPRRPGRRPRFHDIRRVVTNSAVFDFDDRRTTRCACVSVHPGVTRRRRGREHRLRARRSPSDVPATRDCRRDEELQLDPRGRSTPADVARCAEVPSVTARTALHTPLCELFGVALPDRADRHGLGVRRAADRGHQRGRRARHPRVGARMTYDRAAARRSREVKERTDEPFGVNLRADQPDVDERVDLLIREGVKVACFAQAPQRGADRQAEGRGRRRRCRRSARGATPRRSRSGASTRSSRRAPRAAATPARCRRRCCCPQVVDAVDIPVVGAGGFFDGRGLVAALAYGASGIAMGTRFLLTQREPRCPTR